ncbi:MAG TPA: SIS domain-containing protein [Usitatibacter sp.]|nr:SIS domain-containing protein [Usitatibacter sp.]
MSSPRRDPASTRMFQEAAQAGAVVRAQIEANAVCVARLAKRLRDTPPRMAVTCARGSSDHAATFAKYLFETRLGLVTASAAPSVSSVYGARQDLRDALFLTISQSGRSPDIIAAARAAQEAGALVVAAVNDEASPLATLADFTLPLCAGEEKSVAATKSYVASLSALVHLASEWSRDTALRSALARLPGDLDAAWALDWTPALEALTPASHLYVIARGVGLGIAQEAALKCKETCGLHAEAFSSAEVRHGPQALLRERFPALVFCQDDETRSGTQALARELAARDVPVWLAGGDKGNLPSIHSHAVVEPILLAESFYRFANALAVARGHDPDDPPHLRKVTETL